MIQWHWRVLLSALLGGSVILWCGVAAGQQLDACDPKNPADCVVPLIAGQVVPFNGLLLGPRRAAVVTVKAEHCQERIDLSIAEERERGEVRLQAEQARRAADQEATALKIDAMRSGLAVYQERFAPHWYQDPTLWFFVGVVTAAGVTAAAVAIIDATRPAIVTAP